MPLLLSRERRKGASMIGYWVNVSSDYIFRLGERQKGGIYRKVIKCFGSYSFILVRRMRTCDHQDLTSKDNAKKIIFTTTVLQQEMVSCRQKLLR